MDPLSKARALLPFWLPFVSLLAVPVAFGAGWLAARVLTPLAYRRVFAAKDAHWTERARLAWPARRWTGLALVAVSAIIGALVSPLGGPLALVGRAAAGVLGGAAALAGFALGTWPAARRLHGAAIGDRRRYVASSAALLLVRVPHVVVAGAVAAFMPPRFSGHGAEAALLLLVGTALVFAAAFGGGLALGRLLGLFRAGDPRLVSAAESAASAAGVPPPGTGVLTCHLPAAFAIPLRRILAVSDSALALFDDAELEAVVAHETGHLTESASVTFQRVSGLLLFTLLMAAPSLAGEGGRTAFFALLLSLLALVAVGAFSRRTAVAMEVRADAQAVAHARILGVYARALEKMHEAALVPAVLGSRLATHPDLWDRMAAAGAPPAWPRPAKPASGAGGRLALVLASGCVFVGAEAVRPELVAAVSRGSALAAVALTGGEPWALSELARERAAGARPEDAVVFYRAAFARDGRPGTLANAAFVENRAGRCPEAKALADEAGQALARLPGRPDPWDQHLVARAADVAARCGRRAPDGDDAD